MNQKPSTKQHKQQKQSSQAMFTKHRSCFPTSERPLGVLKDTEHIIETDTVRPMSQPPYRRSWAERIIIRTEVDKMLKAGIATPSKSPWASPIVLVKKKMGQQDFVLIIENLIL